MSKDEQRRAETRTDRTPATPEWSGQTPVGRLLSSTNGAFSDVCGQLTQGSKVTSEEQNSPAGQTGHGSAGALSRRHVAPRQGAWLNAPRRHSHSLMAAALQPHRRPGILPIE